MSYEKLILGSGDSNVGKAALLAHFTRLADVLNRWEDSVLHTCKEYHGELKSLCRMYGHKDYGVCLIVIFINVTDKRNFLKEAGHCWLNLAFLASFLIFNCCGDKFLNVFYLRFTFKAFCHKHIAIAAARKELLYCHGWKLNISDSLKNFSKFQELILIFRKHGIIRCILYYVIHRRAHQ